MSSIPKKRSLADMQHSGGQLPQEFNDSDYEKEVLQLEGTCEIVVDEALAREATTLGIDLLRILTASLNADISGRDSTATATSDGIRTSSVESGASASTGITSSSSNHQSIIGSPSIASKVSTDKRPLSFSAYGRFLAKLEAQQQAIEGLAHITPSKRPPSIFSVSTQKSYNGLKSSFKSHFKLRRHKTSTGDLM